MNDYKFFSPFFFFLKGGVNVPSYPGPPGPAVSTLVYHQACFHPLAEQPQKKKTTPEYTEKYLLQI